MLDWLFRSEPGGIAPIAWIAALPIMPIIIMVEIASPDDSERPHEGDVA